MSSANPYAPPSAPPPPDVRPSFTFLKKPAAGMASLLFTILTLWLGVLALRIFSKPDIVDAYYIFLGFQPQTFLAGLVWTPLTFQFLHENWIQLFYGGLLLYLFGSEVERRIDRPVLMFVLFVVTAMLTAGLIGALTLFDFIRGVSTVGMWPFAYAICVIFLFLEGHRRIGPVPVWIPAVLLMLPGLPSPHAWGGLLGGLVCRAIIAARIG